MKKETETFDGELRNVRFEFHTGRITISNLNCTEDDYTIMVEDSHHGMPMQLITKCVSIASELSPLGEDERKQLEKLDMSREQARELADSLNSLTVHIPEGHMASAGNKTVLYAEVLCEELKEQFDVDMAESMFPCRWVFSGTQTKVKFGLGHGASGELSVVIKK